MAKEKVPRSERNARIAKSKFCSGSRDVEGGDKITRSESVLVDNKKLLRRATATRTACINNGAMASDSIE